MKPHLVIQRVHSLGNSLTELKVKIRTALATELATAVGTAVRDILIVALIDRLVTPSRPAPVTRPGAWRDDEYEDRDRWGERDPWAERDEYGTRGGTYKRDARDEGDEFEPGRAVPAVAAVAVGVNVGRWWLARKGTIKTSIALGTLATMAGLHGGPVTRAALAVFAAATDVLTAESALSRS